MAIFGNSCHELVFRHDRLEVITDGCQCSIPDTCTECGVEQEGRELHLGQTCRNGNELAYSRDESANEGRQGSVLVEVRFGMLYLGFINQAHVPETAIGKLIDDRATYEIGQAIIDERTDIGTDGSKQNYQEDIEFAVSAGSLVGSRRNDHFRREGDEGTFDGHQDGDGPVIQMVKTPLDKCNRFHK